MVNKQKIAVIGPGYWGKNLVRNFKELGALSAIVDSNTEQLATISKEFDVDSTYADINDVLCRQDIQAIVIATPAATHYQLCKDAINAGKDVFVEKPLALHVEEAEELVELARAKDRILMVDHLLQYHPAVEKLKEIIDAGTLGKLQYMYSNRLNIGKLRTEENILWSFAPHDISVILSLTEKEPTKVSAFGEAYLQDGVVDTTVTHIQFKDRLKAHIYVSWLHPFKEQKLVVIGNKAMAVFNDMNKDDKLILYPHKIEWIKQVPIAAKADQEIIPIEKKEPLREACQHFLNCIESRTQPKTNGKEALAVLKILQQAQEELEHER